jgi:phosphoribosylanthranilate isomerase
MKTTHILKSSLVSLMLLLSFFRSEAQDKKQSDKKEVTIEIIQFHSEHRCMTCNKIEALTRETLKEYTQIPFTLLNVDEKKNEKKAAQFEATGTALFLYNPKTGQKKDLTDFAFMNAGSKEKFYAGLKKEIDQFLKL